MLVGNSLVNVQCAKISVAGQCVNAHHGSAVASLVQFLYRLTIMQTEKIKEFAPPLLHWLTLWSPYLVILRGDGCLKEVQTRPVIL